MGRRLPPFAAIKAFEAAARHCNFQQAADELLISSSAVSHQVKALEDHLGIQLFIRNNNRLSLTPEGSSYHMELRDALDLIEQATARVAKPRGRTYLTVSLFPAIAEMWLIPRLGKFHDAHPDITVRLLTMTRPSDLAGTGVDLAIHYSSTPMDEGTGDLLFEEEIVPVCSATYLRRMSRISDPKQLLEHTLIFCNSEPSEWSDWLTHQGLPQADVAHWLELDARSSTLSAAKEGLGIAIGRRPFIDDAIADGSLVMPVPRSISTGYSYYLVSTKPTRGMTGVRRFRDWLLSMSPPQVKIQVA
jgi:LysR family glycine cleavage system transcriptional activator